MTQTIPPHLVSVVILTWNRKTDITETIKQVLKSTYKNIEIIVVDNGSTDGTVELIKVKYPKVNMISLKENIGIAGYNLGIKNAKGDFVVLLDSDSFPYKNTIEKMIFHFNCNPKLGTAAFEINNYNYFNQIIDYKKRVDCSKGVEVTGYNGAGVGFRKECIIKAGLLFEQFFLYMNEQEHAIRILKSGYSIKLFPDLIAFHKQSSIARDNEKMSYYYIRNLLWLIWIHYPFKEMLTGTLYIFFYASVISFRKSSKIYLTAVSDALLGSTTIWSKRSPVAPEIMNRLRIPLHLVFTL